jgi:CRP-like cAMP-binding protein
MHDAPPSAAIANHLIASLPPEEFAMLQPYLELVAFPTGHFVALAGDALKKCYFPNTGMISLLAETQHGYAVEAGFTGVEGMVGTTAMFGKNAMPYQALVQAPTEGFVADTSKVLELFKQNGSFHHAVLRYAYVIVRQTTQTAVCNHFHTIHARLSRWLAVMCERSGNRNLRLTQEFLAHMLGVQRTSIGPIATAMQREGIIAYRRGNVEIVDFERLQASACECYRIIGSELAELSMSGSRQTARL